LFSMVDFNEKTDIATCNGGLSFLANGKGKACCEEVIRIGIHRCTAGGNHLPGEKCEDPGSAYYYTYCTTEIVPCGDGAGSGDGGGGIGGGGSNNPGDGSPSARKSGV